MQPGRNFPEFRRTVLPSSSEETVKLVVVGSYETSVLFTMLLVDTSQRAVSFF